MAIAAGSIVAPKLNGSGGGAALNVRGPVFGCVESGSGPYIVLWNTGARVEAIAAATIDEILSADSVASSTYVGRRIKPTTPSGQTAWAYAVCVAAYKRAGVDTLLLQSPQGEYFLEIPASGAEVVS